MCYNFFVNVFANIAQLVEQRIRNQSVKNYID